MKKAWTIWFTGLHGAGKSTIAENLAGILRKKGIPILLIDGDEIRKVISPDLGYTLEERNEHMKRVADLCRIVSDNNVINIASVASPTEKSRSYAKKIIKNFLLVYVKCPLEICQKRDVKGHYKKAGEKKEGFENFLGTSLKYEEPKNPDIILNTDRESVKESVNKLINKLKEKKIIAR